MIDLGGRQVLITGGSRGLGRATGIAFARAGAAVVLTHHWGGTPDEDVMQAFADAGCAPPRLVESNAGDPDDVRALLRLLAEDGRPLHAIVSNVVHGKRVRGLEDLQKKHLDRTLAYSTWPLVELVQAADAEGLLPRHLVAISSDGAVLCQPEYDLVGTSKAALEGLVRYLAVRLKPRGVRVNAVRPGALDTEAVVEAFGADAHALVGRHLDDIWIAPDRVAQAILGLCSGLLDAVTGQVLVVDEGWSLLAPLAMLDRDEPFRFPEDA